VQQSLFYYHALLTEQQQQIKRNITGSLHESQEGSILKRLPFPAKAAMLLPTEPWICACCKNKESPHGE